MKGSCRVWRSEPGGKLTGCARSCRDEVVDREQGGQEDAEESAGGSRGGEARYERKMGILRGREEGEEEGEEEGKEEGEEEGKEEGKDIVLILGFKKGAGSLREGWFEENELEVQGQRGGKSSHLLSRRELGLFPFVAETRLTSALS
jgi:hypothetical protein